MSGDRLDAIGIKEILAALPHRYPFLLVDRIIECDGDESCIGIKNVTFNEPQFNGHFPGRPVMPGVMLIEGMAQTAGILTGSLRRFKEKVVLAKIQKAEITADVVPGQCIRYDARIERIDSMSAHADAVETLRWLRQFARPPEMT